MNCPKCKAPLEAREFNGIEVDICPSCYGVFYNLDELALALQVQDRRGSEWNCPADGILMDTGSIYGGKLHVEQCGHCGGIWFDGGEIQKLRQITGVDDVMGRPGSKTAKPGADAPAGPSPAMLPPIPVPGLSKIIPPAPKKPSVFWQGKPAKRKRQISGVIDPPDGEHQPNPDQSSAPVMLHGGREYQHYQTSFPVVKYVLGEFNWEAAVGDKARARDFICPPYILSEDISDADSSWSAGEYIEPAEIEQAFQLAERLPEPTGVNPAQPNPHAESRGFMGRWFSLYGTLACGLFLVLAVFAHNEIVYQRDYSFAPRPGVDGSYVTPDFELKGGRANVKVSIDTNLSNNWAFMRMALINAETDTALDFDREIGYYYGSDGGESWSEGSRNDSVILPRVPGGRYYLRVDPEAPGGVDYRLTVARDVPRMSLLVYALLLLGLPWGWTAMRHMSFEKRRWQESDHPWSTEEE